MITPLFAGAACVAILLLGGVGAYAGFREEYFEDKAFDLDRGKLDGYTIAERSELGRRQSYWERVSDRTMPVANILALVLIVLGSWPT
jgi:hypothetical protein